jgi:hypothetical protein
MEENFEKKTANGATALGLPLADLLGKEAKAYFRGDDGDAGADGGERQRHCAASDS